MNPDAFEQCFMVWVQSLIELSGEHALHIDGKTLRHSFACRFGQDCDPHDYGLVFQSAIGPWSTCGR